MHRKLIFRWTIGDVDHRGFEALALSILGAQCVFGPGTHYVVCVNTIDVESARSRVGGAASFVDWLDCTDCVPIWLIDHVDKHMAQGVAWKFAPPLFSPTEHVISLDNDVILWHMPDSIRRWIDEDDTLLVAEDVRCCFGQFARLCPNRPRNSGITGFPPGLDAEAALRPFLEGRMLCSELDEQGLQVAMISANPHRVVKTEEVSISGYFRPHSLELGLCGAHFVGVNAKRSTSTWNGRSSEQYTHEFWDQHKKTVADLIHASPIS